MAHWSPYPGAPIPILAGSERKKDWAIQVVPWFGEIQIAAISPNRSTSSPTRLLWLSKKANVSCSLKRYADVGWLGFSVP